MIGSFQLFNEPKLLMSIAPDVIDSAYTANLYAYTLAFTGQQIDYAAAVSFLLGLVIVIVSYTVLLTANRASNAAITQTAVDTGNGDQVWTMVAHGDQYLIRNAGTGRYVTIAQGSSADLAKAVSWTEQDGPDQLWTVRRIN